MKQLVYADNAATTKLDEAVLEAMLPWLREGYGNASSLYSSGMAARKALKQARELFAEAINAEPEEVYFTSGGTESDNWALKGGVAGFPGGELITSSVEHQAVLRSCAALERAGHAVSYLPVNEKCLVEAELLSARITDDTRLVSIMFANNEVGTVQPIAELAEIAHRHGAVFHTDAVQAVGHCCVDVKTLGVDMLSASAHKFNGPKGVGVLYIRKGTPVMPLLDGGHQECGLRAGTENVAGIVGAGMAIKLAMESFAEVNQRLALIYAQTVRELNEAFPQLLIHGDGERRLPGIINFALPGVSGEGLMNLLDLRGICVSTGSACNAGQQEVSHVLRAMRIPDEEAHSSIRISYGKYNSLEDAGKIVEALRDIMGKLGARN